MFPIRYKTVIDYPSVFGYGPTVKRAIINPSKRLIRMERRIGSTSGAKTSSPKGAHPPKRRCGILKKISTAFMATFSE
ncbi:hypothetical protein TNIN_181061 [Trichonephila inaurata madagascariensis]|uniref:Uncharacterized protein n=1 Tax=Trichonephila inaurata madagascariensis TaxID=2747483 RepID=A0A8X6YFP7_9ARAC|nr:hypothetical protein TNIN_181061 [Trichonephila inaurata madagascariensis]